MKHLRVRFVDFLLPWGRTEPNGILTNVGIEDGEAIVSVESLPNDPDIPTGPGVCRVWIVGEADA